MVLRELRYDVYELALSAVKLVAEEYSTVKLFAQLCYSTNRSAFNELNSV